MQEERKKMKKKISKQKSLKKEDCYVSQEVIFCLRWLLDNRKQFFFELIKTSWRNGLKDFFIDTINNGVLDRVDKSNLINQDLNLLNKTIVDVFNTFQDALSDCLDNDIIDDSFSRDDEFIHFIKNKEEKKNIKNSLQENKISKKNIDLFEFKRKTNCSDEEKQKFFNDFLSNWSPTKKNNAIN